MATVVDPKRTVSARLVGEFKFDAEPGDCLLEGERLMFACPGCGLWGGVNVGHPKPAQGPSWDVVKGNPADPAKLSLTPSIHCVGCCGWHGFLTEGVFRSC
jgi:hypothetical protein